MKFIQYLPAALAMSATTLTAQTLTEVVLPREVGSALALPWMPGCGRCSRQRQLPGGWRGPARSLGVRGILPSPRGGLVIGRLPARRFRGGQTP